MHLGGRRLLLLALAWSVATIARAQPAWVVSTTDDAARTPASTVVLLRHGATTVATLALDYEGPSVPVAIVWPIAAEADAAHVRIVPRAVIDRLDLVSAPHLVERWERDPCDPATARGTLGLAPTESVSTGARGGALPIGSPTPAPPTDVAAHGGALARGEVVVLSAMSPETLDAWLLEQHYRVPADLQTSMSALHVSTFVVARIEEPSAGLPALRATFRSPVLALPLVAAGEHDLVVQTLVA